MMRLQMYFYATLYNTIIIQEKLREVQKDVSWYRYILKMNKLWKIKQE